MDFAKNCPIVKTLFLSTSLLYLISCQSKTVFRKEHYLTTNGKEKIYESKILKYATLRIISDSLLYITGGLGFKYINENNQKTDKGYYSMHLLSPYLPMDSICKPLHTTLYVYEFKIPRISKEDFMDISFFLIPNNDAKNFQGTFTNNSTNLIIDNSSGIWCSKKVINIEFRHFKTGKKINIW